MHRHGAVELLVVLPDGSKTLLPAVFTDAVAAAEVVVATVGSIEDLEQLAVVVESLMPAAVRVGVAEDATGIPIKEDPGASDESVGVRPRRRRAGTSSAAGGSASGGPAGTGSGGGGGQVGDPDRQVSRRGGVAR
jgi:hypothetical protein